MQSVAEQLGTSVFIHNKAMIRFGIIMLTHSFKPTFQLVLLIPFISAFITVLMLTEVLETVMYHREA